MEKNSMEEKAKKEIRRIKNLLKKFGVPDEKIKILYAVIDNTAWMKAKLDEIREIIKDSSVVTEYDNGGGQKGLRENPIFKGYESLWKSYMSGMNVIINSLPEEAAKAEKEIVKEKKTMLEIVREKHKKEA